MTQGRPGDKKEKAPAVWPQSRALRSQGPTRTLAEVLDLDPPPEVRAGTIVCGRRSRQIPANISGLGKSQVFYANTFFTSGQKT